MAVLRDDARCSVLQKTTAAGVLKVLLRHCGSLQCEGMTPLTESGPDDGRIARRRALRRQASPQSAWAAATRPNAPAGFMLSTMAVGIRIVAPRSLVVS